MRIGCCFSLDEIDRALQTEGFFEYCDFVDVSGKEIVAEDMARIEKTAGILKERNIPCTGVHAAFPAEVRLTGASRDLKKAKEYFDVLARRASFLGCSAIGIGSPMSRNLEEGFGAGEADQQMAEDLKLFCETAPGMSINIESLNPEESNYLNDPADAFRVCEASGMENTGLVCDIYHLWKAGVDAASLPQEICDRMRYIHIADPRVRGMIGADTPQEFKDYALCLIRKIKNADCIALETGVPIDFEKIPEFYKTIRKWLCEV